MLHVIAQASPQGVQALILVFGAAIMAFAIGLILGMWFRKQQEVTRIQSANEKAESIVRVAQAKAETLAKNAVLEGERQAEARRREAEAEEKARRHELLEEEQRLRSRETQLLERETAVTARDREIEQRERQQRDAEAQLADASRLQEKELERVGQMSRDEAQAILLRRLEEDLTREYGKRVQRHEQQYKEEADQRARRILSHAIQRCALDHTAETTIGIVQLPSDDLKGRVIGREGRNIRSFEQITGVTVNIDDTPEVVVISSFDPVRREIARRSLQALVDDGRIHPGRIEDEIERARAEVEEAMLEAAQEAVALTGIGSIEPELLKLLGRLKYRFSYGQQILKHSVEVAFLAGNLAQELGTDVQLAKRAGLFHDIGKAVDHEIEGTHALIGADIMRRFDAPPALVHAIEAHHEEVEQKNIEAILAQVADAISARRPGARGDTLDNYVRRMTRLEQLANSFEGVARSYAIQAGRELRIVVHPRDLDDLAASALAREIARKIEEMGGYPGQIKVTVIRETRASATAR